MNKHFIPTSLVQVGGLMLCGTFVMTSPAWSETKVTGDVEVGYQKRDISANEAKAEEYGAVPDGAVIPHVKVQSTSDHDQVTFEGTNIQQNNQSYDLNYNHDYKVKVDASFDQTPHDYSNVGRTLYNPAAPGVLVLPTGVKGATSQTTSQSATGYDLLLSSFTAGAHNANLQTQDNKGAIDIGIRSGEHMRYNVGISEDKIEGSKPQSFALGSSFPVQMPVPVDQKIYNLHAGSQYASKDAQFGLNYALSAFNNDADTLVWDNPRRVTDSATLGAAKGQTALAPDNWAQTISMNGGANLAAKTRVTAKTSLGYMSQNQTLLPFSDNSALSALRVSTNSLPEADANARMLTLAQDYAVSNHYWKPLKMGVHYHSYQMVNQTAEVTVVGRSPWDSSFTASPYTNNRFEYRKDTLEGNMDYQLFNPWSVGARYATEWDHRTDRETTDTTEKTLTILSDLKPSQTSMLRGTYIRAHRRPQDLNGDGIFEEATEGGRTTFENLPGLRRFDTSDRLRDQGKVLMQWNPGPVMLEFNGSLTHDNFQPGIGDLLEGTTNQAQMYGLLQSRDASAGASLGWDVFDRLNFDVYYQYEESKGLQRANTAGVTNTNTNDAVQIPTKDYSLWSVDRYHMAGISANVGKSADRVGVRLAYDVTMSRGADDFINVGSAVTPAAYYVNGVSQTLAPGVVISPADTKYMKQDITVRTTVRLSEKVSVLFGYLFEKYDVTNWQYQNIPLVGGAGANQTNIFLGTNLQNYVEHVGSVVVKYKF